MQEIDEGRLARTGVAEHNCKLFAIGPPRDRLSVRDAAHQACARLCGRQWRVRASYLPLDELVELRKRCRHRHAAMHARREHGSHGEKRRRGELRDRRRG